MATVFAAVVAARAGEPVEGCRLGARRLWDIAARPALTRCAHERIQLELGYAEHVYCHQARLRLRCRECTHDVLRDETNAGTRPHRCQSRRHCGRVGGLAAQRTLRNRDARPDHAGLQGRRRLRCSRPQRHSHFLGAGAVKTTRADAHGAYRIGLPPGIYSVRTNSKPFGKTPHPARVHVRAGHSDKIVFTIDTGIR